MYLLLNRFRPRRLPYASLRRSCGLKSAQTQSRYAIPSVDGTTTTFSIWTRIRTHLPQRWCRDGHSYIATYLEISLSCCLRRNREDCRCRDTSFHFLVIWIGRLPWLSPGDGRTSLFDPNSHLSSRFYVHHHTSSHTSLFREAAFSWEYRTPDPYSAAGPPALSRHRNAIIATLWLRTVRAFLDHEGCRCSTVMAKDSFLFHPQRQSVSSASSSFPVVVSYSKENDSRRRGSTRKDRRCARSGNIVRRRTQGIWRLTSAAAAAKIVNARHLKHLRQYIESPL